MRHARATVLLLLALGSPAAVDAQPVLGASAGEHVRTRTGPPLREREGILVALSHDSLLIRYGAGATPEAVPWRTVYRLQVSRRRASRVRNVAVGVGAGLLGGLLAQAVATDVQGYGGDHVQRRIAIGAGIGAAVGTGVALALPGRRRWLDVGRPAAP